MDTDSLLRSTRRALGSARVLSIAMVAAVTSGCLVYPDSDERIDDDIVITSHQQKIDFKDYKTFAVAPIVKKAESKADGEIEITDIDAQWGDKVVERLASRMEARGFERLDPEDENADLGLTATVYEGLVVGSVSYWGGYWGYYWGYPGWGYYYPYDVYYAYEPGSIIVDMVDLDKARRDFPNGGKPDGDTPPPEPGQLAVVWAMTGYRAYIDDNKSTTTQQALDAIDQAFVQSPYIETK